MNDDKKWRITPEIMTEEVFARLIAALMEQSGYDTEIVKNETVTGLAIMDERSALSPMIRLDMLYRNFKEGKDLQEILKSIADACDKYEGSYRNFADSVTDFDYIRKRLCYKLLNRSKNKGFLEKVPYIPWLDLAVVFYIPIAVKDRNALSLLADNPLMDEWGITDAKQLYAIAHANTQRIFPGSIRDMEEVFGGFADRRNVMYIATNTEKLNGACTVLYDGLLRSFAAKLGKNLYLMPTSTNEMTIVAEDDGVDAAELRNILRSISYDAAAEEDVLSCSVYYYDSARDRIRIV